MDVDRCIICGEIVPEGCQVCQKCEHKDKGCHCVTCGKEIPQPKFSFGSRAYGTTMMEFQYNMRQLCCSDECWDKWIEEIRREFDGK